MKRNFVFFRERDGNSALRVFRVGFIRAVFGENCDARAHARYFNCRAQARDAATNDDEICFERHRVEQKSESRSQEPEEKKVKSVNVASALYSGFWLLTPEFRFPFRLLNSAFRSAFRYDSNIANQARKRWPYLSRI
jgi:hypothetical protein